MVPQAVDDADLCEDERTSLGVVGEVGEFGGQSAVLVIHGHGGISPGVTHEDTMCAHGVGEEEGKVARAASVREMRC